MEEQAIGLDTSVLIDYYQKNNKAKSFFYMIAACALANNLKLATLNPKHFERISDLELITRP